MKIRFERLLGCFTTERKLKVANKMETRFIYGFYGVRFVWLRDSLKAVYEGTLLGTPNGELRGEPQESSRNIPTRVPIFYCAPTVFLGFPVWGCPLNCLCCRGMYTYVF